MAVEVRIRAMATDDEDTPAPEIDEDTPAPDDTPAPETEENTPSPTAEETDEEEEGEEETDGPSDALECEEGLVAAHLVGSTVYGAEDESQCSEFCLPQIAVQFVG